MATIWLRLLLSPDRPVHPLLLEKGQVHLASSGKAYIAKQAGLGVRAGNIPSSKGWRAYI